MSQIIASVYEIEREIGSGGGGIVYLAKHLRLNKQIILKADKRELKIKPEELRREVDILKDLSHSYIPQVYDFVVEDGTVYTVEDYISGQSLDKYLKQGERFSQPVIIEWACELLEALCYLHGRPPYGILHGDIKPANIMLRDDGKICLIDYNIALFLGEEGAVKVGFSHGYASPEHYGTEYQSCVTAAEEKTEVLPGQGESNRTTAKTGSQGSTGSSGRPVLLDVRSDIYSLGATLYHLLTGRRPAQKAEDVVPIREPKVSRAVADIIAKAMCPNPEERYQTAEEMLYAFEHLHEQDIRAKRHRRRGVVGAAVAAVAIAIGGGLTYTGLSQMERLQNKYVMAEYAGNALREGRLGAALSYAQEALPDPDSIFREPLLPEAQKALTDVLGVYDLTDGFYAHRVISLPAEPFALRMSPDGKKIAAVYAYETAVYDLESGSLLFACPMEHSALAEVEFVGDRRLALAGEGGLTFCDSESGTVLWQKEKATGIAVSGDGSTLAAVYKDDAQCRVYSVELGQLLAEIDFGGRGQSVVYNDIFANPEENIFELNEDGSMLAVSFSDGSVELYPVDAPEESLILMEAGEYAGFEGGFYQQYFAFSASNESESTFYAVDTKQAALVGSFSMATRVGVKADETGIYICNENTLVRLDPKTGEQTEIAYTLSPQRAYMRSRAYTVAATDDHQIVVFTPEAREMQSLDEMGEADFVCISGEYLCVASMSSADIRVLKSESHKAAVAASYDAARRHSEARVDTEAKTLMLYDFSSFVLVDFGGKLLAEVAIPDSGKVYDQQFVRNEKSSFLEVTYYDGRVDGYSARDGTLAYENKIEAPDKTLEEEFYTRDYRFVSKLKGAPEVYNRESGKKVMELQSEDYLAYVTEVGDYLIAEYTTAGGERYGLLMNEKCETLARLPDLCDIVCEAEQATLFFDDRLGNIRQSPIYSIGELEQLAEEKSDMYSPEVH